MDATHENLATIVEHAAYDYTNWTALQRDQRALDAIATVDRKRFLPPSIYATHAVPKEHANRHDVTNLVYDAGAVTLRNVPEHRTPTDYRHDHTIHAYHGTTPPDDAIDAYVNNLKNLAYNNVALPIGEGQTCSEPLVVALIASQLDLHDGNTVLEVGAGCGYHAAVTREMYDGIFHTVERIESLAHIAAHNLHDKNVTVYHGNADDINAQYDRVYLTAGLEHDTDITPFQRLLNPDGKLIVPQRNGPLRRYTRDDGLHLDFEEGEFSFVPYVPVA
jgi:protein-L-isoaspartate(D-aspartate) O-methyltransferase